MSQRKRFWCWMGATGVLFTVGGYVYTGAFAEGTHKVAAMIGALFILGAMVTACVPLLDALDRLDVERIMFAPPKGEPCEHTFALHGDPTIEATDTDTEPDEMVRLPHAVVTQQA
jgi:hypothetical protein